MQVKEVLQQEDWNSFFSQIEDQGGEFLQSWQWGKFQKKLGRDVCYLSVSEKKKKIGQILIIKHNLPLRKNYYYCPRGPVFIKEADEKRALNYFLSYCQDLNQFKNTIFLRFDLRSPIKNKKLKRVKDLQPSKTTIINLQKSFKEIMSEMHAKTRYNIRLAQKHGVKIFTSKHDRDFETFFSLLQETAQREKFRIYPKNYYKSLLKIDNFSNLYLAKYRNKILASHLLVFFNKTATYLHGASSRAESRVMAPYLLHWQAIKDAKEKGFYFYDFWGIDKNKWPGLTRFKKNFGGKDVFYPGTFEINWQKAWSFLYNLRKKCFR